MTWSRAVVRDCSALRSAQCPEVTPVIHNIYKTVSERQLTNEKMKTFFEELWQHGDPWNLENSELDQTRYDSQIAILDGRRYSQVLEIGCAAGCFTRRLAGIGDRVVALDISAAAIAKARETKMEGGLVDFREANIMEYNPRSEGPWDLVVMSETIYYLGWLYPFFDVAWLAAELFAATQTHGQLLMANTCGGVQDYLLRPWIIQTYHDLFLNVGYQLKAEETLHGTKNGAKLDILISLFVKAPQEKGS